jgi:hypothetical protein
MLIVLLDDGTRLRFGRIHGDGFDPREGEKYLFEFPRGEIQEGVVKSVEEAGAENETRFVNGIFDGTVRRIAVDV